jgi:hypothetical protein
VTASFNGGVYKYLFAASSKALFNNPVSWFRTFRHPNIMSLLMAGNPQCSPFPNNCYGHPNVERWFSNEEVVFGEASQDSLYVLPSILCCHKLRGAQNSSLWFSSNSAVFAPAILTQFPDGFLSSKGSTKFARQRGVVKENTNLSQAGSVTRSKEYRGKWSTCKRQPLTRESRWCNLCKKLFTRKHDLFRHITSVHGKLKPFPCRVESCQSSFPRKDGRDVSPRKCTNRSPET